MKVSYNWLKDLVECNKSYDELSHILTMSGLEVEGEEQLGKDIINVVIGYIKNVKAHPNADKLSVCIVDAGQNEDLQIVCGASNVAAGQKVPVALVGSILPGNFKIKKAKLRGVESFGMICSAKELGIDDSMIPTDAREGIWVLDEEAPIGENFVEYFSLDDIVFEIGLTPNRADCLSMINVAREVKANTGGKLKLPEIDFKENNTSISNKISVDIKDTDLCYRYTARLVENVQIKPSPNWLQARLRSCGIRSINNIVDVTNYVMLETGQPLHAFDYDLLSEKEIIVRRSKEGEKITSLDGVIRELDSNMLVIADKEKPVAVAGVMGGFDTEVNQKTNNILLESACFKASSIRHTSRKLGLRSESSNRFEKGVDREGAIDAVNRAAQLLEMLADGDVAEGIIDNYPEPIEQVNLKLRVNRVNFVLGTELDDKYIGELLKKLSFKVEKVNNGIFNVEIPSYRQDIKKEVDLIEEVARLYGYDNIKITLPVTVSERAVLTNKQIVENKIKENLASIGLSEVVTFSFINPEMYNKLILDDENYLRNSTVVSNPLSEDQGVMRTILIPGLIETAVRNKNRRIEDVSIFEIGRVFNPGDKKLPDEKTILAGLIMGKTTGDWKNKKTDKDFYYCKGIIDYMLNKFFITAEYEQSNCKEYLHPGKSANILVGNKLVGYIGELHPRVCENFDLEDKAIVFEVDIDMLSNIYDSNIKFEPLPKHPGITRDLAVVVEENVQQVQIENIIKNFGKPLIRKINLFDVYKGKQIAEGYKSLAYSIYYQADDRTLIDEEVNKTHDKVWLELEKQLNAKLR